MFKQSVIERIGYYVYALRDPRNDKIFYIGKGYGNRIFMHLRDALEQESECDKLNVIREISRSGLEVGHFIVRHNLSQEVALEVESALIDLLGLSELKNKVKGHHSLSKGIKSVAEITEIYDTEEVEIEDPVILITINKYFSRELHPDELYRITRYCWRIGSRRNRAEYVLSVYKGLVREVYGNIEWKPVEDFVENPQDKGRWQFYGDVANDQIRNKYLGKSVSKYVGAQNPVRYVNC